MTRLFLLLMVLGLAAGAAAQDAHYWDTQYGTKAELLGGLVVGAPSDISATFYNPAWIALRSDPSLLLTTRALEYSKLTMDSRATGDDAAYSQFRPAPGFLGGRFGPRDVEGWTLSWSYLERMRFRYDASAQLVSAGDTLDTIAEAYRQIETNDNWYGVTFSRKLGERTGLGVTLYGAYRSQHRRDHAFAQGYAPGIGSSTVQLATDFSAWHLRTLAKIGLAFDYRPVSFGVTVTTPSVGLMGGGQMYQSFTASNVDIDDDGVPDEFLAGSTQEDLDSRWKTPLSVAAGASWRSGRWGVHVTAEWFNRVSAFDLIEAAPYTALTHDHELVADYSVELRSVLNFGVGLDHRFSERFAFYGAVRSDFAAQQSETISGVLMSTWDMWHMSAGASYRFLGVELTTGLEYSHGTETAASPPELPDDGVGGGLVDLNEVDVDYRRLKLLLGFDLSALMNSD